MLIQFNFKNFKGFRNETTLDMTAASIKEHPYNLIDSKNGEKYTKVAAIYGANASGKSSVIQALLFMKTWVLRSFKDASDNSDIPVKRFAFDTESKSVPAEFEVFFQHNYQEYQYGFSLDNNKVYEEWLYIKNFNSKDKYINLFERNNSNIKINPKFLKGAKNFIPMLEDKTLFISIISNAKLPYAKDVFQWFSVVGIFDYGNIDFEKMISKTPSILIENENYKKDLLTFLKDIDINIEGIVVEKEKDQNNGKYRYKIYTNHRIENSNDYYKLPISEESSGTQKMFSLFFYLKTSIELGFPIFIDELDSKLHPLLLRYIITMFHSENINKEGAQLIYTTHDNYTLTKDIFRRDEIWFVAKDKNAVSDLYSLVEYKLDDEKKVRKDASYSKDYLLGKYGAIPILKEFNMWGSKDEK